MIPFIGFRVENIGQDGLPCEEYTGYKGNVLQAEWFGRVVFIFVGRVWLDEQ